MGINQKSDRNDLANVDANALVSFVRGLPLNRDAQVSFKSFLRKPAVRRRGYSDIRLDGANS